MSQPQTAEPQPVPATGPPAGLYLDLLKRCITRFGFDEDLVPVVSNAKWKRQLWHRVNQVLDRKDIVVFRRSPFDPELRTEGGDWPARAESMIGLRRLDNLQGCIERALADGTPGDVLEAGVWRGGASILARGVLAAHGVTDRVVWVADSFQGLPKPDPAYPADATDEHSTQPTLAVSIEQVQANFGRYQLLDDQVRFLPGWFSDTLPTAPIEKLAVLRADGDMYGSTMDVLNALYPKVSVGGFVIIDDYGAVPACQAATDDYRAEHGITEPMEKIDWTGVFWQRQR